MPEQGSDVSNSKQPETSLHPRNGCYTLFCIQSAQDRKRRRKAKKYQCETRKHCFLVSARQNPRLKSAFSAKELLVLKHHHANQSLCDCGMAGEAPLAEIRPVGSEKPLKVKRSKGLKALSCGAKPSKTNRGKGLKTWHIRDPEH